MNRRQYISSVSILAVAGCVSPSAEDSENPSNGILRDVEIQATETPNFDDMVYEIDLLSSEITRSSTALVKISVTNSSDEVKTIKESGDRFPFQGVSTEEGEWLLIKAGQDGVKRTSEDCAQLSGDRDRFGFELSLSATELSAGETQSIQLELWAASEEWAVENRESCMPVGVFSFDSSHHIGGVQKRFSIQLGINS